MRFRPCIDIHNGKVKQIVGSSLQDHGDLAVENYISEHDAAYYANMYKFDDLHGGHIIILNSKDSEFYEEDVEQAKKALLAYPQGLQIGGGINDEKTQDFLLKTERRMFIVTSFVFQDGCIYYNNLNKLVRAVGKEHIVLDLSCRKKDGKYYVVTDRWQKFTDVKITPNLIEELSASCDEFLIHAAM
jgi:phosphoribosylformimino-5-aminoimidazole carboxamide ribotide isomerase